MATHRANALILICLYEDFVGGRNFQIDDDLSRRWVGVFCQVLRASSLKYRVGLSRVPFKASKMCVHIYCRVMDGRLTIVSPQANFLRPFFILMCTHLALYVYQFWMRRNRGSLVSPFARCVETCLRLRLWLIKTPCVDCNWYPGPIKRPQHQRSGTE